MDGSIIKHDGILGKFFLKFAWDPYKSHWNYQVVQM